MDPPFFYVIDRIYVREYNDNATSVADRIKRGRWICVQKVLTSKIESVMS